MKKITLTSFLFLFFITGCTQQAENEENTLEAQSTQSQMTEVEAKAIAEASCIKGGEALGAGTYNPNSKTWWFDANLNATMEGCDPACVVWEETKTAEINWRCTGAIEEESTKKPETTLKKVKEDERFVYYEGAITLTGTYNEYHPNTMLGGLLCFNADEQTGYLIPRTGNDERAPWFCFDNQDEVKALFGINDQEIFTDNYDACIEGKATIEISNYVVDTLEAETADKAKLEKIISKEPYTQCK